MKNLVYFILSLLFWVGCVGNKDIEKRLIQAEQLIDEQPDSAFSLLNKIDGKELRNGSSWQAHYALLYTKTQYKLYMVAASDSLINIAVDYYEENGSDKDRFYACLYQGLIYLEMMKYEQGACSLLRAESCSSSIDDYYSLGQMYNNLAYVNSVFHCPEGEDYAQKAYSEYLRGNLLDYALDAKTTLASFKLKRKDFSGFRSLIDSIIIEAENIQCIYVLGQALSLKAQYAVVVDSTILAEKTYRELSDNCNYEMSSQDYGNLAVIHANNKRSEEAESYLGQSQAACFSFNDTINFYTNAYWVYSKLNRQDESAKYQDSLLSISERLYSEGFSHSAIAAQRDYSELKLSQERRINNMKGIIIIVILISFVSAIIIFLLMLQRKKLQAKLQEKTIQKLQLELFKNANEISIGLEALRNDSFVSELHEKARVQRGMNHEELNYLHELFNKNLPHFEKSLHELAHVNETEMFVCMLLKLYMTPGEISVLLNKSAGGISSIRRRLYLKVFNKKGSTTDWDAFIDTI